MLTESQAIFELGLIQLKCIDRGSRVSYVRVDAGANYPYPERVFVLSYEDFRFHELEPGLYVGMTWDEVFSYVKTVLMYTGSIEVQP